MVTRLGLLITQMKGCDFSMGIYTEKRDQLIEKIKVLEKRIASDTAKKENAGGQAERSFPSGYG